MNVPVIKILDHWRKCNWKQRPETVLLTWAVSVSVETSKVSASFSSSSVKFCLNFLQLLWMSKLSKQVFSTCKLTELWFSLIWTKITSFGRGKLWSVGLDWGPAPFTLLIIVWTKLKSPKVLTKPKRHDIWLRPELLDTCWTRALRVSAFTCKKIKKHIHTSKIHESLEAGQTHPSFEKVRMINLVTTGLRKIQAKSGSLIGKIPSMFKNAL